MKRRLVLAIAAGLLAAAATAAPAASFTAPELFVRAQTWDSHEATGGWVPLAGAPAVDFLGGFQIGYRLQEAGVPNDLQHVALTITGVPDGRPTQPYAGTPYCVGRAGSPGTIVEAGPELQFEGDGTYTVRVAVGPGSGGPADCLTGPATTASFRVGVGVAPVLVGSPVIFRAQPLPASEFVGVRAAAPPGGGSDVRCALDATVAADGSVTGPVVAPDPSFAHPEVIEGVYPRPGAWTCVARGVADGLDASFDQFTFGTPWSAPLRFDVASDFRRRTGTIAKARTRHPRLRFKAEWPAESAGGGATVTLYRVKGCRRSGGYKRRRIATYSGRFGAARLRLRVARPGAGVFIGRFAFGGTRFIRASVDPAPLLMTVANGRMGFVAPSGFPACGA